MCNKQLPTSEPAKCWRWLVWRSLKVWANAMLMDYLALPLCETETRCVEKRCQNDSWRKLACKKKKKKSKSELLCDATALTNILQSGKVLFEFSESASHEFIIEHIMDLMLPGWLLVYLSSCINIFKTTSNKIHFRESRRRDGDNLSFLTHWDGGLRCPLWVISTKQFDTDFLLVGDCLFSSS